MLERLRPFIVTSWGGTGTAMDPDVKEVFEKSEVAKDANVFMFVLDSTGAVVHGFKGLPGGRNPAYVKDEIGKAVAKIALPDAKPAAGADGLPDVKGDGTPAGVRLFVRSDAQGRGKNVIVEALPLKDEERKALRFPGKARELEAETFRAWLVQMYPAGIRTADQSKPFKTIAGTLTLEPSASDGNVRTALLRGPVKLARGDDAESAFEGTLEAVLTYGDGPEVRSLRGVVEGTYLYRQRGAVEYKMTAAIESRPE